MKRKFCTYPPPPPDKFGQTNNTANDYERLVSNCTCLLKNYRQLIRKYNVLLAKYQDIAIKSKNILDYYSSCTNTKGKTVLYRQFLDGQGEIVMGKFN